MEKYLIQVNHFITSLEGSYSGLGKSIPNSVKHSCDFVAVSIFTLQFFVRLFSPRQFMTQYVQLAGYIENVISMFSEMLTRNFSHPYTYKVLILKTNSWFLELYAGMMHQKRVYLSQLYTEVSNCAKCQQHFVCAEPQYCLSH